MCFLALLLRVGAAFRRPRDGKPVPYILNKYPGIRGGISYSHPIIICLVSRSPYSFRRNGISSPFSCACPNLKIYCSGVGFPPGKYLSQSAFSSGLDIALSQLWSINRRIVRLTTQTGHPHSAAIVRNTLRTFRKSCKSILSPHYLIYFAIVFYFQYLF